jgi:glycosyltransferase involved in cell wall biosynthesis
VGRHFWPHGSIDAAARLIDSATGLHQAGFKLTVVTPKYAASWSERFSFRDFEIKRPVRMFKHGWTVRNDRSPARYIQRLSSWLADRLPAFDVLYVDGCREEAIASVSAARSRRVPVVIRLGGHGAGSDIDVFRRDRNAKRFITAGLSADQVIVNSASAHRAWISLGGSAEKTTRIHTGIGHSIERTAEQQKSLRHALAQINGDLLAPEASHVVLSVERMNHESELRTLVHSAYSLDSHVSQLLFWFVGDGPTRDTIFARLKSDGLRQSVALPGSFATMDDVFCAADLLVQSGDEGFEAHIPNAIASGLPLVMANTDVAREFFDASAATVTTRMLSQRSAAETVPETSLQHVPQGVWWFDPNRPKTLRFAIEQITRHPLAARRRADQLRRLMQRQHPRSTATEETAKLLRQLAQRSAPDISSSDAMELPG